MRLCCLACIVVAAAGTGPALARGQTPGEASPSLRGRWAVQRHEIAQARADFRAGARDTSALERAVSERMLGVMARLYDHDFATARTHLDRALGAGDDTVHTLAELARLAAEQQHYRDAYVFAARAERGARTDDEHRLAISEMARAVVEAELETRVDHVPVGIDDRPQNAQRDSVLDLLQAHVHALPGRPRESRLLIELALLAGNGDAARLGWDSFQLLGLSDTARGPIPAERAALDSLLPRWHGAATSQAERAAIEHALFRAHVYAAAALIAPSSSEVVAYVAYCRRLEREVDAYYRRTLLGERRPDELLRVYYRASHDLWARLSWPHGAPPPYYPAAVAPELERRFGAIVNFGTTAGFYDLHMGHIVASEQRTIEQYGRRARLRFITLDGMVTNGLQSWAWNGEGAHGGWQRGDTIIQVRPVYVTSAFDIWGSLTRAAQERAAIAADSAADWQRGERQPVAFFPSVVERLRRDGSEALRDSLRASGLSGAALASAFIAVVARVQRESAIQYHEGRHALDERFAPGLSPAEREYRAKLAEIAFNDRPKLIMSSIVHPNIGDATPHGQANARLMQGIVRWMRAHAAEISGLDAAGPLLPQLPLLTDAQLRAAFRAMDPWADVTSAARVSDHTSPMERS